MQPPSCIGPGVRGTIRMHHAAAVARYLEDIPFVSAEVNRLLRQSLCTTLHDCHGRYRAALPRQHVRNPRRRIAPVDQQGSVRCPQVCRAHPYGILPNCGKWPVAKRLHPPGSALCKHHDALSRVRTAYTPRDGLHFAGATGPRLGYSREFNGRWKPPAGVTATAETETPDV